MAVHTMAILTMASWRAVCARAGGQRRAPYYLLLTTYYLLLTTYYLLGGQRRARAACATLLAPRHRPRRRPDVRRVLASSSPSHPPPILLPSSSVSFPSPGEFCQFILLVSRWLPAHYTEKELRHMFHKSDLNGELRLSTYYYSHYYSRCSLLTTLYLLLTTLYSLLSTHYYFCRRRSHRSQRVRAHAVASRQARRSEPALAGNSINQSASRSVSQSACK